MKNKVLFALYDENDRFINCGFSLKELGIPRGSSHRMQHNKGYKRLYRIPLYVRNDIFKTEDKLFLKELAKQFGVEIKEK